MAGTQRIPGLPERIGAWRDITVVRETFTTGAIPMLTWGGLRGGISVALALSLPENEYKGPILAVTYAVVVFSIIVQGLSMKWLVDKLGLRQSLVGDEENGH